MVRDELDKMVERKRGEVLQSDQMKSEELQNVQRNLSLYEKDLALEKSKRAQLADLVIQENNRMAREKASKIALEKSKGESFEERFLRENAEKMNEERLKMMEARRSQKEMVQKMLDEAERRRRAQEEIRNKELMEVNRQIMINNEAFASEQAHRKNIFNSRVQKIDQKQKMFEAQALSPQYEKEKREMIRMQREMEKVREIERREEEAKREHKLAVNPSQFKRKTAQSPLSLFIFSHRECDSQCFTRNSKLPLKFLVPFGFSWSFSS